MVDTMDDDWDDVDIEFVCKVKSTLMETQNSSIFRACPFWENKDGITSVNGGLEGFHALFDTVADRVVFGKTDDSAVKWAVPYPVVGKADDFWVQHEGVHQV